MTTKLLTSLIAALACAMPMTAQVGITRAQVTQDTSCTGAGNPNDPVLKITVTASSTSVEVKSMDITLDGTTDINDYEKVKIYYDGNDLSKRFDEREAAGSTLLGEFEPQAGTMTCNFSNTVEISGRGNTFYVVASVADDAKEGNHIDASLLSITTTGGTFSVDDGAPEGDRERPMASPELPPFERHPPYSNYK